MKKSEKRPIVLRLIYSIASLGLIFSILVIFFGQFTLASALILAASTITLSGASIAESDGVLECISGFFEVFLDGIFAIFEGISALINSIFS